MISPYISPHLLARREDDQAELAPSALARRLVDVVVEDEVGRLRIARELAGERVHVLLAWLGLGLGLELGLGLGRGLQTVFGHYIGRFRG